MDGTSPTGRPLVFVLVVMLAVGVAPMASGAGEAGGRFVDDDASVHQADIEAIAGAGVTVGCNPPANDRFCPEDSVTRAQMASFLRRAVGDDLPSGAPVGLTDIGDSVHADDIAWLGATGVTRGCDPPVGDRFCPEETVTRGQMAAFLVRAFRLPATTEDHFADDEGLVFEDDIDALAEAAITRSCSPSRRAYCPEEPVTRAQMASFLTRALDLSPVEPGAFPAFEVSGTGPQVRQVQIPGDALAVAVFTYEGQGDFRAESQDIDSDTIDVLVDRPAPYRGARPVNVNRFGRVEPIRFLAVSTPGAWTVRFEPLAEARFLNTSLSGTTDEVLRLHENGTLARIDFHGVDRFAVISHWLDGETIEIIDAAGPLSVIKRIPGVDAYLEVIGDGDWMIQLLPG